MNRRRKTPQNYSTRYTMKFLPEFRLVCRASSAEKSFGRNPPKTVSDLQKRGTVTGIKIDRVLRVPLPKVRRLQCKSMPAADHRSFCSVFCLLQCLCRLGCNRPLHNRSAGNPWQSPNALPFGRMRGNARKQKNARI